MLRPPRPIGLRPDAPALCRRTFTSSARTPQVPRRLLADHAQGDGAASARAGAGPRLVAEGRSNEQTTGNVVDPIAVIDEWGVDAFRYVVRELDIWTDESFQARYSAELANGLGNLVNRSLSMLNRYRGGTLEAASDELAADAEKWIAEAKGNYESHQIQAAAIGVWDWWTGQPVRRADRAIQAG